MKIGIQISNYQRGTKDAKIEAGAGAVAAEAEAEVACLTLSGQRSQSALNWPIGVGDGTREGDVQG